MFFIIFLASNIFFKTEANAGFLSFIEKIWNFGEENKEFAQSAAFMPLLEAPKNSDLFAGKNSGNINIVGGDALFANSGPLGTILDIQNMPATQISIYTVRAGDTLSGIAEMFNVDTNTIRYANNIKRGGVIKTGSQLVILPIPGIRYSIKKGDTVKSIAKKFGSEEDDIIAFNDIDLKNGLSEGEVLIIPNGELHEDEHLETKSSSPELPKKKGYGFTYPLYTGYYARPVLGGIKTQGIHGYNGVDLADDCGSPIYAAASGDVIIERSSGYNGGYGKYLVISHANGTQTLYSHNSSNVVKEGSYVKKGQLIGYIGITGRTTGCHLHFEIRGAKNPF